jgi:uncharacterized protein (TIGR02588 family)
MTDATQSQQPRVRGEEDSRSAQQTQEQQRGRSLAEWVSFGIASAILLAVVGLVIYDWVAIPQGAPTLSIAQDGEIREESGQFYVPFVVENVRGNTAEAVQVMAELRIDGEVVESGEQQIDFLSGRETHTGAFVFTRDPAEGELVLRIGSYKEP